MAVVTSTVIAAVAVVASLAAAGVGAYASYQQGQMQKKAADYNAAVQRNNALIAQQQAQFDANRVRERNRRLAGAQAAGYAKSGTAINSGSALDVQYDSSMQGELDALTTIYRGNIKGYGSRNEATYLTAAGKNAETMANYNAGATLLSGAGSAAGAASKIPTFNRSSGES